MLLAAGMAGQWEVVLSLLWRRCKGEVACSLGLKMKQPVP